MSILASHVLTLNKFYSPNSIITVSKALSAIFSDRAKIVDYQDGLYVEFNINDWMDFSQFSDVERDNFILYKKFLIPRVIRYINYDKEYITSPKLSRRNILKRDNHQCQYCGKEVHTDDFQIDHILPRAQGGKTVWTNCVTSCHRCNNYKGNRTPYQAGMKLIRKPVKPKFAPDLHNYVEKYDTWKKFISEVYWNVELID